DRDLLEHLRRFGQIARPPGGNVGIIKDPLLPTAKLVAVTRPLPNGHPDSLLLSSDGQYLYVGYRVYNHDARQSAVFVYHVPSMIAEVTNDANKTALSDLTKSLLPAAVNKDAGSTNLTSFPIDELKNGKRVNFNPDIDVNAEYLRKFT